MSNRYTIKAMLNCLFISLTGIDFTVDYKIVIIKSMAKLTKQDYKSDSKIHTLYNYTTSSDNH